MKKVRFGVIGVGGMGSGHARWCAKDGGKDLCLTAVCDIVEDKARRMAQEVGVPYFTSGTEMMDSGLVDAVVIATPHYWHPPLAIHAARRGPAGTGYPEVAGFPRVSAGPGHRRIRRGRSGARRRGNGIGHGYAGDNDQQPGRRRGPTSRSDRRGPGRCR